MSLLFTTLIVLFSIYRLPVASFSLPPKPPSTAQSLDLALISISIEFFAFPGYVKLPATGNCLANIQRFRGYPPAVRIGGTTQDRATYNATDMQAVTYSVPSSADAPDFVSYGPDFFSLAADLPGDVTIGLNRQLNQESNSLSAAKQAAVAMHNLFAIELGNEPEFYNSTSPIIPPGQSWDPSADAASQNEWFTDFGPTFGSLFQGAVYLQEPTWGTAELIPKLTTGLQYIKSFSGHSYPQSACGGASTNLTALMDHLSIVSYTSRYKTEASAAHAVRKRYFLGETNSATCGGGGISPTFGAALWIVDYSLQAALQGVERLYFHQGTIAACPYCWWNDTTVNAPYYGAAFLSQALGTDTKTVAQLDSNTNSTAIYAFYNAAGHPHRLLVINSEFYNGQGTRSSTIVTFSGVPSNYHTLRAFRMTASSAVAQIANGDLVTIGGASFNGDCLPSGSQSPEFIRVKLGSVTVSVQASEAIYIVL